jgi:hypothetical protein
VVVVLISLGLVVIGGAWLSWYSPAALSEEDAPHRPWITDGVGRPRVLTRRPWACSTAVS